MKELDAGRVQVAMRQFVPEHEAPFNSPEPVIDENQVPVSPLEVNAESFNRNLMDNNPRRSREQPKIVLGQHARIPFRRSIPLH